MRLLFSIRQYLLACLIMLGPAGLQAAVQAELDRHRIVEGETVMLTIRTDDPRQNLEADFGALERDFDILDRRSETQLSIVNGEQTAVVRLLLTLEPRRAGELEIPPLVFGREQTRSISVRVDPAPELEPGAPPPVFIEVEVSPGQGPYLVHAQLGLVVRVFYQQNLTEAAISPPEPSPASVRLLQETPYQAERGGERYRVLERVYAVFPERSGQLLIPPMKLTGRLVERKTGSIWQPTARGRRVQVESEAVKLSIEPKPQIFSAAGWQPARAYQLTQQVSSGEALRVGEPITRTVIVDVVGLEENMIVEPAWPDVSGVRIYPDQPQGITRDDGRWVLGHKEFRYAIVPEKAGELLLPELQVQWWDTQNNRPQTAVLEAHTVYVQPPILVPSPALPAEGQAALTAPQASSAPVTAGEAPYWRILASLFAFLWIVTLFAAWRLGRSRGRKPDSARAGAALPAAEASLLGELKRACERDDSRRARKAFLHWLHGFGPVDSGASLLDFARGLDDELLCESVYDLDSDGFHPDDREGAWRGKVFWKRFENWRRHRFAAARRSKPELTDLYARENRLPG